jgi:hypothetical protein
MTWNYRVMKRKNDAGIYDFGIHEVYYDEHGNINSWTENPLTPTCSSEEDLQYELTKMMEAFKQEALQIDTERHSSDLS